MRAAQCISTKKVKQLYYFSPVCTAYIIPNNINPCISTMFISTITHTKMVDQSDLNNVASVELKELKGIALCSLNIRGLYRKLDEVRLLLDRSQVDVLVLNETFLNSGHTDRELAIKGYHLYRLDRDEAVGKKGGGGVAAYCTTERDISVVNQLTMCTRDVELLWLKLQLPDTRDTFICSNYRPPDGNVDACIRSLNDCLTEVRDTGTPHIVVLGDVNIDLAMRAKSNDKSKLTRFLTVNDLSQLINCPTRVTDHSETLIDHIYTNRPELYPVHGTCDPGLSDHYLIFAARRRGKKDKKSHEVYG